MIKILPFLATVLIAVAFQATRSEAELRPRPVTAPKAKVSINNRAITFAIRDNNVGNRDYFIVLLNSSDRSVVTRKKIPTRRRLGAVTIRNLPVGSYIFYTAVTSAGAPVRSSPASSFRIRPTATPTATPSQTPAATQTPTPTLTPTVTPTQTPTPLFAQISSGYLNTCALFASGATRCWGYGNYGGNGHGNTDNIGDDETPRSAGDTVTGRTIRQISAGEFHICGISTSDALQCWGYGGDGQLGYGNTNSIGDDETPASSPAVDLGAGVSATSVAVGRHFACVLLNDQNVKCFGQGDDGRLGYGNTISIGDDETPASVGTVNLGGASIIQISVGSNHACALSNVGNVYCWGEGANGKLGHASTDSIGDDETPNSAGPVNLGGNTAVQIAASASHTCALLSTGAVMCWGYGGDGQIGYGNPSTIGDDETPGSVGTINLGAGTITQISAGFNHTCALFDSGVVKCWGFNQFGQLGYGNTNNIGDDEAAGAGGPVPVGGLVRQISAGGNHTCALLTDDSVRCWGLSLFGVLGYGNSNSIGDDETPASVGAVLVAD